MKKLSLLLALFILLVQSLLSPTLVLAESLTSTLDDQELKGISSSVKSRASPTIKLNSLKIFVGSAFEATDMIDSAVDGDGLPIDFSDLTVIGADEVDTSKYGVYEIGFSYEGSDPVYEVLTVSEAAEMIPLSQSQEWPAHRRLDAKLLVSMTSMYGVPDYDKVSFNGQTSSGRELDPEYPEEGTYNVTATYQDTSTSFELVISEDQSELILSKTDLTIDLDDTSELKTILDNPYSIIESYKDENGNDIVASKETVTVTQSEKLNPNPDIGKYNITYSGKNGKSAILNIVVTGDKIQLIPQDLELIIGDFFDAASGLKSATDIHGKPLDIKTSIENKTITVSNNVNTSKQGEYSATYTYRGVTTKARITVRGNSLDGIYVDSSKLTRYQNDNFNARDLIHQVIYNGEEVDKSQVAAIYDTSKINNIGTFDVTFTYQELIEIITVTVNEDKSSLSFRDGSLEQEVSSYSGHYTEPFINLRFTYPDGKAGGGYEFIYRKLGSVTAECTEGNVSTSVAAVNYFTNQVGTVVYTINYRGKTAVSVHHVLPVLTAVETKDSTLVVDSDTWEVDDNFVSATTYDGKNAKYDAVKGSVPTDVSNVVNAIGVYEVEYTKYGLHTNDRREDASATATIRVIKDQAQLNVKGKTIYYGDDWKASDHFVSGLTSRGDPLTQADVATDTHNTSENLISYTIMDSEGKQVDNIDNTKSARYTINYQYGKITESTTLTVVTYTPTITVHDSSIFVGSDWTAADNLDLAYNAAGKRLSVEDLVVNSSEVDVNTPGIYQVEYAHDEVVVVAKIEVKKRFLTINVHNSKIVIGSSWNASDNFDSAADSEGNTVTFDQLTISITDEDGKVVDDIDTSKVGTYTVSYDYIDFTNTSTHSDAKVEVYSAADLQVTNVRIPINTEWDPGLAFITASSPAGEIQTWEQIKENVTIIGNVDSTVAKSYPLIYEYEGVTKDVIVTVVGERILSLPRSIDFGSVSISSISNTMRLFYPGGDIKVEDSVEGSKGWTLRAKVIDENSDFNQYLMNGNKTLSKNSEIGSASGGGRTIVSEGWQGTKKGLWIDYGNAQMVRRDNATIEYTLIPLDSEVSE